MLAPLLIGLVTGLRSLTPIALVSAAASRGDLPADNGAARFLARPAVAAGLASLAAGEALGDKLPSAPDRIIAPGLAARAVTGGLAGAALAPRRQRMAAMALGASAAIAGAYLGFGARMRAMRGLGQTSTGLVEDALAAGAALWIVDRSRRARPA